MDQPPAPAERSGLGPPPLRLLTWALGVPLASWRYVRRRGTVERSERTVAHGAIAVPAVPDDVQRPQSGRGPLYRRRYAVDLEGAALTPELLIDVLASDPNVASPTEVAIFVKTRGEPGDMAPGDEYRIRMPGPWDGPVRVVARAPRSFRLATLPGHLEAGTIEFRARTDDAGSGLVGFEIESWARSANAVQHLMYRYAGISKAIQGAMWESFLERVALVAGARRRGLLHVETEREADPAAC